jgi:hypothetical protein
MSTLDEDEKVVGADVGCEQNKNRSRTERRESRASVQPGLGCESGKLC